MRILIFLLALISAFFVSAAVPDMTDLRAPKTENKEVLQCVTFDGQPVISFTGPQGSTADNAVPYCAAYLMNYVALPTDVQGCPPSEPRLEISGTTVKLWQSKYKATYFQDGSFAQCGNDGSNNLTLYAGLGEPFFSEECPPASDPEYVIPVDVEGNMMCAKEKGKAPDEWCPEPTGQEITQFSPTVGPLGEICFSNNDGSICRITTDENSSYPLPLAYGNQEGSACPETPREPVEEPEKTPTPDKPDESADPTPTEDPPDKSPNTDANSSDATSELGGINQINDNLTTINSNMNKNSDSNDARLDALLAETKNTNELLSSVKQNTAATTNNTGKTLEEIGKSNEQLYGLNQLGEEMNGKLDGIGSGGGSGTGNGNGEGDGEGEGDDGFSFTAGRKSGGLNDIFTDEQIASLKEEITTKKDELKSQIETIQSEANSLIDISIPSGGAYEQRIENIKGVDVDMGLGRISEYFRIIGTAIMLVASITALYILLGAKE